MEAPGKDVVSGYYEASVPPYPPEFRREAVQLVRRNRDKSIPEVADDIGVSAQSLRNWLKG